MHDLDHRIRSAVRPLGSEEQDDAAWQQVAMSLRPNESIIPRPRRRLRLAAAIVATCFLLTGVAVAAEPDLLDRLFPKGSDVDRMQVMREPAPDGAPADEVPDAAETIMRLQGGGPIRLDGIRILLTHRDGEVNTTLYAFPTKTGAVCHYWKGTFGSGSCGDYAFQPFDVITYTPSFFEVDGGWKTTTSITGLTTDDVVQVRVRLADGTLEDAVMGRNSFLWYPRPYDNLERYVMSKTPLAIPKPERSEPAGIEVELTDGTIRRL
jgi:hypothetical protein